MKTSIGGFQAGIHNVTHMLVDKAFWGRFFSHLAHELALPREVFRIIMASVVAGILYVLEFKMVGNVLKVVAPPLVIFLVVQYLTLLPTFFAFVLMIFPITHSAPVFVFSFISSLLIILTL
jgi:hypothetical protein